MTKDRDANFREHSIFLSEIAENILNGNNQILSTPGVREIIALYLLIPYITNDQLYAGMLSEMPKLDLKEEFIPGVNLRDLRDAICHSFVSVEKSTKPVFEEDAVYLNNLMKGYLPDDIKELMGINPKLAHQVYEYIQAFEMKRTPVRQAALTYNGIAFQGLDAGTFTPQDWDFAQNHLLFISGLYGIVRPMDKIKPYRLEAKIKLENKKGKDLYAYWSDTVTKYLSEQLLADDNIWINLASDEYSKMINRKALPKECMVVTPTFKEQTGNGYKMIVVYAKKARGMMSRFIVRNRLKKAEDIKHFDAEGYSFSPNLSKNGEWVFVR